MSGSPRRLTWRWSTPTTASRASGAGPRPRRDQFSSKHFRTWGGTVRALLLSSELEPSETKRGLAVATNKVIDAVSGQLGNTRTICRKCYVHPLVLASWQEGRLAEEVAAVRRSFRRAPAGLGRAEYIALRWLERTTVGNAAPAGAFNAYGPTRLLEGIPKLSLVTCPVTMEPARTAGETLRFHTVNRKTGNRVESRYVDAESGKPIPDEDRLTATNSTRTGSSSSRTRSSRLWRSRARARSTSTASCRAGMWDGFARPAAPAEARRQGR